MKLTTLFLSAVISVPALAQINDGGFEAGIGAGTWTEASVNYGTPLCDAGCGTCGGPCVSRTGDIYSWFGGAGVDTEIGSVDQDVTIADASTATVDLYVKLATMGDGTDGNYLRVLVDGTEMGRITALDSADFEDYTLWSVDVSDYTDGASHNVKIEGKENGGGIVFNALVDDVSLTVDGSSSILFDEGSLAAISIYPNPANENITFDFKGVRGQVVVRVMDISGKTVLVKTLGEVSGRIFNLDASAFANGTYAVMVQQDGKLFTERVVVAH